MKTTARFLCFLTLPFLGLGCSGGTPASTEQDLSGGINQRALDVQTMARLKNLGFTYQMASRPPRGFNDLLENTEQQPGMFQSARDKQQFEVVWGVNMSNASTTGGGGNALLAWEKTPAPDGGRCVLMANCSTVQYLNKEEFEKAPRAKGR